MQRWRATQRTKELSGLADYAVKTLNLSHWFAAFVSFTYITRLDRGLLDAHNEARKYAQEVAMWLGEQFNRLLAEEQLEMNALGMGKRNGR